MNNCLNCGFFKYVGLQDVKIHNLSEKKFSVLNKTDFPEYLCYGKGEIPQSPSWESNCTCFKARKD